MSFTHYMQANTLSNHITVSGLYAALKGITTGSDAAGQVIRKQIMLNSVWLVILAKLVLCAL